MDEKRKSTDDLNRIDHVGLTVRDLDAANSFLREVLGFVAEGGQPDVLGKRVAVLRSGQIVYELIEHLHPAAVGRFQEAGDDWQFHHLAVEVDDLKVTTERLRAKGVKFTTVEATVSEIPSRGRRSTMFTVPETTGGLIFQFVQYL